jgi:glyoxylase-like metal-dependent hydrolase (beta-lactamase superfamily II)
MAWGIEASGLARKTKERGNHMKKIILAILASLALTAFFVVQQHATAQTATPEYTIEAIRFGTWKNFRLATLLKDAPEDQKIEIAVIIWLIRGGGHTILFDSGYHKIKDLVDRSIDYAPPDQALRESGVDPASVTDIIISHVHGDHMDGLDLFPNATVWIQKAEYEYYTKDAWQPGGNTRGADPGDILDLVRQNTRGKVRFVNGDNVEIFPGITAYTGARHTFASQYIRVAGNPPYVLASDNCYLYENVKSRRASGNYFAPSDETAQVAALDRMVQLAGSPDRVIPGHDMLEFQRFPVKGRVARIR